MHNNNETMIGVFADRADADQAITELKNLGYSAQDISIMVRDQNEGLKKDKDRGANVAEGTATGATTGGAVGALTGLLVGIGAITLPGIGALFIGGPIAAALGLTGAAATAVSAAASGVLAGGLVGALVGLGLPEETAKVYETRIREGAVVVAVPIMSTIDRSQVQNVYENNDADQIRTVTGRSE